MFVEGGGRKVGVVWEKGRVSLIKVWGLERIEEFVCN